MADGLVFDKGNFHLEERTRKKNTIPNVFIWGVDWS